MSISDNESQFHGLTIQDFESSDDWQGADVAYRVRTNWDSEVEVEEVLKELADHPEAGQLSALVIGLWSAEGPDPSDGLVGTLAGLSDKFRGLRAIFFGDITYEECEISWIEQSDMSPLLHAYPRLETFRVRGGTSLKFGRLAHASLKQLIVETGGLGRSVLREIFRADLPNLEHLELWLGSDNYGWDGGAEDLQPLLAGKLFPKLTYLGLRNCESIDDLTPVIVNAPLLRRIRTLDLSLGNLSDTGANSLLALPKDVALTRLDLSHHYLSDDLVAKLQATLPCEVITNDAKGADDEWRSIYVSE